MRGRRRRYRDAEGVDGVGTGERLGSLGERGELPSRVRGAARPQTPFRHFQRVTERFRRKENATLLLTVVTDKVKTSLGWAFRGLIP